MFRYRVVALPVSGGQNVTCGVTDLEDVAGELKDIMETKLNGDGHRYDIMIRAQANNIADLRRGDGKRGQRND